MSSGQDKDNTLVYYDTHYGMAGKMLLVLKDQKHENENFVE